MYRWIRFTLIVYLQHCLTINRYEVKKEFRAEFEAMRNENEQLKEGLTAFSYGEGLYGIYVPDDATDEECEGDIEGMLSSYGFYSGEHYNF